MNKTQPSTDKSAVAKYMAAIPHAGRREDAEVMLALMKSITGEPPVLWGPSIVGFGSYHYVYESGREGDALITGFAARKANMVVYIMPGFSAYEGLLEKLGKHKTGSSCLYLGRLSSIDLDVLQKLITHSVKHMRKKYNV